MRSAMLPFEMNRFWPSRTHSSPSRRAVVCRLPASLPAWGSVRAHAPNLAPFASGMSHFFFCSSEANQRREVSDRDVCTEDRGPDGRRAPTQFLHEEHERDVVHARAAVLLRHGSPEEPQLGHLRVEGPRDLAFLFPQSHVGDELSVDELAGGLLDEFLLLSEPKVHQGRLSRSNWANRLNLRNGRAARGPEIPARGPFNGAPKRVQSEIRQSAGRSGIARVLRSNRTFAASGRHDGRSFRRASGLVAGRTWDFLLVSFDDPSWLRPAQIVSGHRFIHDCRSKN